MGNDIIQTPNIDRLSERGVRFDNTFCTTAICAASRASIFTGEFRRTHGYTGWLGMAFVDQNEALIFFEPGQPLPVCPIPLAAAILTRRQTDWLPARY